MKLHHYPSTKVPSIEIWTPFNSKINIAMPRINKLKTIGFNCFILFALNLNMVLT